METQNLISSSLTFLLIFVPVYMVAFLALLGAFFFPQIYKVNIDIQTKRGMLLYLPVGVVSRIRSIRKLIESITTGRQM